MPKESHGDTIPCFVGRSFEVVYDGLTAVNRYADDGRTLHYEITAGALQGAAGQVSYSWQAVAAGVFAITWQETDGATVVHVDDFIRGTSLSFFTTPELGFHRLSGSLRPLADRNR